MSECEREREKQRATVSANGRQKRNETRKSSRRREDEKEPENGGKWYELKGSSDAAGEPKRLRGERSKNLKRERVRRKHNMKKKVKKPSEVEE